MQQKRFIKMKKKIIIILICAIIFMSCSDPSGDDLLEVAETRDWTVMIYLDADNNLEQYGIDDFNEMEKGIQNAIDAGNSDITNRINYLVMIDRCQGYWASGTELNQSDWTDTRLYRINADTNMAYFASKRLDDGKGGIGHIANLGEKNMGDPATLNWFINYSKTYFPAYAYSLVLWNHGGGTRSKSADSSNNSNNKLNAKAVCWDEDNNGDALYIDEVQQALSANFNSKSKLDVLGFDACLMAMVEVAYEFKDLARYMVGSMNEEQGDGWWYDDLIGKISASITAKEMAAQIVRSYHDYIEANLSSSGETQSAVDLSLIDSLKTRIDALAVAIYNENKKTDIQAIRDAGVNFYNDDYGSINYPFYDLFDFCNNISEDTINSFSTGLKTAANDVINTLDDVVVYAYGDSGNGQTQYYGEGSSVKRGLSIFFSRGNEVYDSKSHYAYQWWYTAEDTVSLSGPEFKYGKLDFCDSDSDGNVESWRELMEAWYDPSDTYTPATF